MDIHIKSTILLTRNINKLVKFYAEILGLKLINEYETVAFFKDGLVIHDSDTYLKYINRTADTVNMDKELVFYLVTSDIDKILTVLNEKKIPLIHSIQIQSWGEKCIRLYDPDGNIVEIGDGNQSE